MWLAKTLCQEHHVLSPACKNEQLNEATFAYSSYLRVCFWPFKSDWSMISLNIFLLIVTEIVKRGRGWHIFFLLSLLLCFYVTTPGFINLFLALFKKQINVKYDPFSIQCHDLLLFSGKKTVIPLPLKSGWTTTLSSHTALESLGILKYKKMW